MLVSPGMPMNRYQIVITQNPQRRTLPTIVEFIEKLLDAVGRAVDKVLVGYPTLFDVICCGSVRILFSSVHIGFGFEFGFGFGSSAGASASEANNIPTENSEKQIRFSGAIFLALFEQRVPAAKRVSHICVSQKRGVLKLFQDLGLRISRLH